ncbi:ABC-2 type transport system ATP-binding protein [Mesobacillus persicus]|uniref:ABC-2 type transport system ATP-binding protein n=1 Tax=Mesobacillus persicus TaxID=930146 RepID=A0A1H8EWF9_9BACI|nr:ABC transporter ATP-binding protein [Mesobacillus persicus]SEN23227.1 ABC-2 type transport system ATP-binding protein [Mesobacillus persicus]
MKVIESKGITKNYFRKQVLKELTFSIEENKITGLIGRNGAGKTTLLKIIAGFIRETSGKMNVFSETPFNSLNVSVNSIFVDDQMSFPPALQLGELLNEAARFYPNWDDQLARKLFNYFSFDAKGYHNRLSKGKTSTFNMIIGLASRCPLTIFDEPTTGMDEAVRKDFYRALLKDYIDYPRTIILSSHHLDEIEDLLEDVLLIHNGMILLHMPVSDLKEWAIGVKGASEDVLDFTKEREVLYKNSVGMNTLYVVVKNDFSEEALNKAHQLGLELTPVRSSDLFVYLTTETKGGIDDVFNNN